MTQAEILVAAAMEVRGVVREGPGGGGKSIGDGAMVKARFGRG